MAGELPCGSCARPNVALAPVQWLTAPMFIRMWMTISAARMRVWHCAKRGLKRCGSVCAMRDVCIVKSICNCVIVFMVYLPVYLDWHPAVDLHVVVRP